MIKHILSVAVLTTAISFESIAQCVIDNSITTPGYYPDTLDECIVNTNYDQTVQIAVAKDTVVSGITANITKATLTSIDGLPAGISYTCNPSSCDFPGNSTSCVLLSGTPTVTGHYELYVHYTTYFVIFGQTYTSDGTEYGYFIDVVDSQVTSINPVYSSSLSFAQIIKLGSNNKNEVDFYATDQKPVTFEVYNMLGKLMYTKNMPVKPGLNTADLGTLDMRQGVYILYLTNGKDKISKRVVVN